MRLHTTDVTLRAARHHGDVRGVIYVLLHGDIHTCQRETDDGAVGGTVDETVQRLGWCVCEIPRADGRQFVVAYSNSSQVP